MNNQRRKELAIAHALLQKAFDIVDRCHDAEEEAHENMPENMQFNSERSDELQDNLSNIDYARTGIEDAKSYLEDNFGLPDVNTSDLQLAVIS